MNDPLLQTVIVGSGLSAAGVAVAFYLWSEHREERFLLFWALAWAAGLARWLLHYPGEVHPVLREGEGLMIPLTMFFMVLGSYDLLPDKPWRQKSIVLTTAMVFLAYGTAAITVGLPIEMGYALFAAALTVCTVCTWIAYRSTGLKGYVFASVTCVYQFVVVMVLLVQAGGQVANSIIPPLYNVPLMLSIVVIAYQRRGRELLERERTLQTIFETAPTPLIIVRPPVFEIERANAVAFEMLGISPEEGIGRTSTEQGLVRDAERSAMYAEVASRGRLRGHEMKLFRAAREERVISLNAERISLDDGERVIFSFHDLTELRQAEQELRDSADEMRELYVRLANVEDDERRALHAELHDQVGANLAALRLELDVASSMMSTSESPGAKRHLAGAREIAAETIVMARDLMAELRPPALDDYGLVAALRSFAELQGARLDLPIDVEGSDLIPRPGVLVEGALYRIAHEAVMNAARHASATRVLLRVGEREGRVTLTIEDDGSGFSLNAPDAGPDHWGLKNMRERARAVGGTFTVDTSPGAGTRVTAEAPR